MKNLHSLTVLIIVLGVFTLGIDIAQHGLDLLTLGAFGLVFIGAGFAWRNKQSRCIPQLQTLCVAIVFFAITAIGITDLRPAGVGLMLGTGFILLLRSIEPTPPAGGGQQGV